MVVLERRLQLLLDQERYGKVSQEAQRSGRSVAAVIREAIDWRFGEERAARQKGAERVLAASAAVKGVEPSWEGTKRMLDDDLERSLP